MNLGHILFSFSGRINRAKWWLAVLITIIIHVVVYLLTLVAPEGVVNLVAFVVGIAALWIALASGAKRLHDLNRSAAWLVVFVGGPILLILVFFAYAGISVGAAIVSGQELSPQDMARVGGAGLIFGVLYLALLVWALIWFGCLRGTVGPNQYGADPLEGRA